MRLGWIKGIGFLVFLVVGEGISAPSGVPQHDLAHRAVLEKRLETLQAKKDALEGVPGSLDLHRHYQVRIDGLNQQLGRATTPFSETPIAVPAAAPTSSPLSSEEPTDVDYFHDRSQIVAVDRSIQEHGGIHLRSSLLDDLPRTNLSRAVAAPPKKGIVIDGSEGGGASMPVVATAADLGRPSAILMQEEPKNVLTEPRPEIMASSLETSSEIPASQESGAAVKKAPAASVHPLTFPQEGMPPPLWGQAASRRDYANKTGWSIDPVPITTPLFYVPPPAGWGGGLPQGRFTSGAFPSGGQGFSSAEMPQAPSFSFPPKRLSNSWSRG